MAYSPSHPPVEVRSPAEFEALPEGYALGLAGYRASLGVTDDEEPAPVAPRDTTTRLSQRKKER